MGGVYCLIVGCSPDALDWAALILVAIGLVGISVGLILWARNR
jgi:hypothetical protein